MYTRKYLIKRLKKHKQPLRKRLVNLTTLKLKLRTANQGERNVLMYVFGGGRLHTYTSIKGLVGINHKNLQIIMKKTIKLAKRGKRLE